MSFCPSAIASAMSSEPSRRCTRPLSSGSKPRHGGAEPQRHRRDVDLGAVALDRLDDRRRHVLGRPHRHVARQLGARLVEHPGVADEAGEDGRDADAGVRSGPRAARARSRAARTSSPSRSSCAAVAALPDSEETNTSCPWPRATIPCDSARASTIGARRLTASARSISSTLNESSAPEAGSAALATSTSALLTSPSRRVDLRRLGEVARDRRARRPPPPAARAPPPAARSARAARRARPAPARSPGRCHRSRR